MFAAGFALLVGGDELCVGVTAAWLTENLPLPTSGFEVYMAGAFHGLEDNDDFGFAYLKLLHAKTGLRDIAIEEDGAYEEAAQAFVDGKADALLEEPFLNAWPNGRNLQRLRSSYQSRTTGSATSSLIA